MRLSTSTNILDNLPGGERMAVLESLTLCREAGFKVFDMNFCDNGLPNGFLLSDDWEKKIDEIMETSCKLGIEFSQSHLEFYNVLEPKIANRDVREELVRRGIAASGKMGVKWTVLHLGTIYENGAYSLEKSRQANMEYIKPHLEQAASCGVGIAVENLPDKERRRFGGTPGELIEFVDEMGAENLGICWDIGHANLMKIDQAAWIREIGYRLKAVHVADNCGEWDEHMAPYSGNVDWPSVVHALKEINFPYDFTYEIHNMTKKLPLELRKSQLRYLVDIGEYLLKL
jgi:sugar phosphate isomerase/epimerase